MLKIKNWIYEHETEILTGVTILGYTGALISSNIATLKNADILKSDLSFSDKFKACWKSYLPSAALYLGSTGACVGAEKINSDTKKTLTAAYAYAAFGKQCTEEAVECCCDTATKTDIGWHKIHYADTVNRRRDDNDICFYDEFSATCFYSRLDDVLDAERFVERELAAGRGVSFNEFRRKIGLEDLEDLSEDFGWWSGYVMEPGFMHTYYSLDPDYSDEEDQDYILLDYHFAPFTLRTGQYFMGYGGPEE